MKTGIVLLSLLFLSGCGIVGASHHYCAPSMEFSVADTSQWNIIAPQQGQWESISRKAYLREYFSKDDMLSDTLSYYNFFYALHTVEDGTKIALLVNSPDSYFIRKITHGEGRFAYDTYTDTGYLCTGGNTLNRIIVCIHPVSGKFENSSVYILKNGRKLQGREVRSSVPVAEAPEIGPAIYDLSDPALLKEKKPWRGRQPDLGYAMFSFLFDMTCRDFEDAVLVVGGLSYQGQELPPLKVRMRYFDFDAVPAYQGPGAGAATAR